MEGKVEVLTKPMALLPFGVGGFFQRMLSCAYCTGFHCGWVLGLVTGRSDLVVCAFSASAFCYTVNTWVRWLESYLEAKP